MNLVIDQGNTYSKIAFYKKNHLVSYTKEENTNLKTIEKAIKQFSIKKAIIASVSDATAIITSLNKQSIPLLVMNHQTKLPMELHYNTPESLGLDRIAAAVGAISKEKVETALIIDIGTAITYDICSKLEGYQGGSIAPGLDMRLRALNEFTKRLPLVTRSWSDNTWAKSTTEALRNGAQEGIIAEINHYIEQAETQFKKISVFLTGGDANFFERKIKNDIFVVPNLVLDGLMEILKLN